MKIVMVSGGILIRKCLNIFSTDAFSPQVLSSFQSGDAKPGHWEDDHVLYNPLNFITGTRKKHFKTSKEGPGEYRFLIINLLN